MAAARRLALYMDGTWNDPDSQTNVHKLCERTAAVGKDGRVQLPHYVQGVGTKWYEKVRGGAFGKGLSNNVQAGYSWIAEQYQDGDEIYVFGFSRGAYTARSVVGFMSRCGLLRRLDGPIGVERLFERYKAGKGNTTILGLRELQDKQAKGETAGFSEEDRALLASARRVPVKLIGVWDTVGALGIPSGKIWTPWNKTKYYFHDLDLSSLVENACHALAIDENRKDYAPSLWSFYTPDGQAPRQRPNVEQRWFPGAHSNVGGGYAENRLSDLPLAWIAGRAEALGLAWKEPIALAGDEHKDMVIDSYERFAKGVYQWIKERHHRVLDWPARKVKGGTSDTLRETIDGSVFARWREPAPLAGAEGLYRPQGLVEWAAAKKVDPAALASAVSADDGGAV